MTNLCLLVLAAAVLPNAIEATTCFSETVALQKAQSSKSSQCSALLKLESCVAALPDDADNRGDLEDIVLMAQTAKGNSNCKAAYVKPKVRAERADLVFEGEEIHFHRPRRDSVSLYQMAEDLAAHDASFEKMKTERTAAFKSQTDLVSGMLNPFLRELVAVADDRQAALNETVEAQRKEVNALLKVQVQEMADLKDEVNNSVNVRLGAAEDSLAQVQSGVNEFKEAFDTHIKEYNTMTEKQKPGKPGKPVVVEVVENPKTGVIVEMKAPTTGAVITHYIVGITAGGKTTTKDVGQDMLNAVAGGKIQISIVDLAVDTEYQFTFTPVSVFGEGGKSDSSSKVKTYKKATCTDGRLNGDEAGTDCGGKDCGPCNGGGAFFGKSLSWSVDGNTQLDQVGSTITLARKDIVLPFDSVVCATTNGARQGNSGYASIGFDKDECYKEASTQSCAPNYDQGNGRVVHVRTGRCKILAKGAHMVTVRAGRRSGSWRGITLNGFYTKVMPKVNGQPATGVYTAKHSSWSYSVHGGGRKEMIGASIKTQTNSLVHGEYWGHVRNHGSWAYSAMGFDNDVISKGWDLSFGPAHSYGTGWEQFGHSRSKVLAKGNHRAQVTFQAGGYTMYNGFALSGFYTPTMLPNNEQLFACVPSAWSQTISSTRKLCEVTVDLPFDAVLYASFTAHAHISGSQNGKATISIDDDATSGWANWESQTEKYKDIPSYYSQDMHGPHWSNAGLSRVMTAKRGKHKVAVWATGSTSYGFNGMAMNGFFFKEMSD
jgi:hypothetical protein